MGRDSQSRHLRFGRHDTDRFDVEPQPVTALPRRLADNLWGSCRYGQRYPNCLPCPGTPGSDCTTCDNDPNPSFRPPCNEGAQAGLCSGNQGAGMLGSPDGPVSVSDSVIVPPDLKPGSYVLGWRLDCEATAQVWSSCADIEIV